MTGESQQEEEERTRLQANNREVEGEASQVETHAQSGIDRQEGQQIDASSAATADTRQECNTNPQTRTREQEAEVVVAEVRRDLRSLFVKSEELIKRLGNALKKVVKRERDICEGIKTVLKEEIAEGIISTRTIELHCPPEWRREWKHRSKFESEKNSLSRPQSMVVAKTCDGRSVTEIEKEVGNGLDTSPPQSKRSANDGINVDISKCGSTAVEFSVPFEPLHQQMIAAFNSNNSVNRVWFTGKFNHKTGEVIDIRIGKITDTNTTAVKKESKTSVVLKDDTLNDITGD